MDKETIHPALLKLTSALFIASEASLWLDPGLRFLQRTWSFTSTCSNASTSASASTEFSLRLHGILADLNWGGWKLVAIPLLLKATRKPENLTVNPRVLIDFLAGIVRARKLHVEDVDLVWKENWERWLINDRLTLFEAGGLVGDDIVSYYGSFPFQPDNFAVRPRNWIISWHFLLS